MGIMHKGLGLHGNTKLCTSLWAVQGFNRHWSSHNREIFCVQGMGTALQRIGQNPEGTVGNGVSNDDPNLVAYWTFDEGRGYVVHDVTKRGHDLYLTSEPHWEVSSSPDTDGDMWL